MPNFENQGSIPEPIRKKIAEVEKSPVVELTSHTNTLPEKALEAAEEAERLVRTLRKDIRLSKSSREDLPSTPPDIEPEQEQRYDA